MKNLKQLRRKAGNNKTRTMSHHYLAKPTNKLWNLFLYKQYNQNDRECILREHSNEDLNFVRCFLIGCLIFYLNSQPQDEAMSPGQIRGKVRTNIT